MSNAPIGPYGQGAGLSNYTQQDSQDTVGPGYHPISGTQYASASDADMQNGNNKGYGTNSGVSGDSSAYVGPSIGGQVGGAQSLANLYSASGANAQKMAAAQINAPSGADPYALAQQQASMAALQRQATGGAPSASAIGQSAGINQGLGAAFAAQRGGYGGAGAALGARGMGAVAQGGAGRMGEYGQAMGGLSHGANEMSGMAVGQAGQDQRIALQQANLTQQQQATNNQAQLGWQNLATNTGLAQLQADTNWQLAQSGDAGQVAVANIQNQAATNAQLIGAGAGGASAALGTLASAYQNQGGGGQAVNPNTGMTDTQENNY